MRRASRCRTPTGWPRRSMPRSTSCSSTPWLELQVEPELLAHGPSGEDRVGLLVGLLEAGRVVDPAGAVERAVRPQGHPLVTLPSREPDAPVDQPTADAEAPRPVLDEEKAKLSDVGALADAIDRTCPLAIQLGDPGLLALGVAAIEEVRDDAGNQCDEGLSPTVLWRIQMGVALDDPAVVAGA